MLYYANEANVIIEVIFKGGRSDLRGGGGQLPKKNRARQTSKKKVMRDHYEKCQHWP